MKYLACKLSMLVILVTGATGANAAITCSLSVTNINQIYNPASSIQNDSTGSITLNCTRGLLDATSTTYWIGINQGESAPQRRLIRQSGTQTLNYSIFRNSGYSQNWNDSNSGLTGTLNFSGALATSASTTVPYYFRITRQQTGKPAGVYDDTPTVTLRFSQNGANQATATLTPVATIIGTCLFSTVPGPVVFNYTSFSATPVAASTNFSINCTNGTPYTMALNATSGTLLGLPYTVGLSASNATGSGSPQNHTVTGSIAANQSGTCGTALCSATQAYTVTISY